jgi:sporulation protein YlmC with PRC-barrel domain
LANIIASKLRDKEVVTDSGVRIGELFDLTFSESTGELVALIVRPFKDQKTANMLHDTDGNVVVPYNAVQVVKEFIIVDGRKIPQKKK